jgi:hypothetical protein
MMPPFADQNINTMRRSLLLFCVPSLAVSAQPVIQFSNLAANGTSFALHLVTNPGTSNPLPDGANITWDFSSATLQMNVGTMAWVDPSATPQGSNFPTSNKAQQVTLPTSTFYNYYDAEPGQLDQLANEIGDGDNVIYSDPKTQLIFPFNYQDSFVDNYNDGSPQSTTRTYSGYGTVILPTGTYTNVAKITSSSGSIAFLTTNPVAQLVNIDNDGTVLVFGDPVLGVGERAGAAVVQAFPNPATDRITITGVDKPGTWELLDAEGRIQRQGQASPGLLDLPVESLASGCYAFVLRDAAGSRAIRVVKQ